MSFEVVFENDEPKAVPFVTINEWEEGEETNFEFEIHADACTMLQRMTNKKVIS
jgi:hypothetical protein